MGTSKEYADFLMEQFSSLGGVSCRKMMGDYILYYQGKIPGGFFDNRLLVKPVQSAIDYVGTPVFEHPFEGAKEWLLIEDVDNAEFLCGLLFAMYDELPYPKPKKHKKKII